MTYKVILRPLNLRIQELKIAYELCIDGGADYVKTGTRYSGRNGRPPSKWDLQSTKGAERRSKLGRHPDALETVDAMLDLLALPAGIGRNKRL